MEEKEVDKEGEEDEEKKEKKKKKMVKAEKLVHATKSGRRMKEGRRTRCRFPSKQEEVKLEQVEQLAPCSPKIAKGVILFVARRAPVRQSQHRRRRRPRSGALQKKTIPFPLV